MKTTAKKARSKTTADTTKDPIRTRQGRYAAECERCGCPAGCACDGECGCGVVKAPKPKAPIAEPTARTTARHWAAVRFAERAEARAQTDYFRCKTMVNREAWEAAEKAVAAARLARDAHEEAVRAALP